MNDFVKNLPEVKQHLNVRAEQLKMDRVFVQRYPALAGRRGVIEVLDVALYKNLKGETLYRKPLAETLIPYSYNHLPAAMAVINALIGENLLEYVDKHHPRGPITLSAAYYDNYLGHVHARQAIANTPEFKVWESAEHNYTTAFCYNERNIVTRIEKPFTDEFRYLAVGDSIFDLAHADNLHRRGGLEAAQKEATQSFYRMGVGGGPIDTQMEINGPNNELVWVQVFVQMLDETPALKVCKLRSIKKFPP